MTGDREPPPHSAAAVDDGPRPAGDFGAWLDRLQSADNPDRLAEVPCGTCTACCRAAYFIHVAPDETRTLAAIPRELLFAAPGLPRGHKVLGFDAEGHCPMLRDGACSIYPDRPRTCRQYDCRVFTATGLEPGDSRQEIAARARQWRFRIAAADRPRHAAVRAAADFLRRHGETLADGVAPRNPTQLAALAIAVHPVFLDAPAGASVAALAARVEAAAGSVRSG